MIFGLTEPESPRWKHCKVNQARNGNRICATLFEKRKKIVEGYDDRLDYENTIAYFSKVSAVNEIVFFQTQGIDIYFALRVLKVHPLDMWYPRHKDLIDYGVIN